MGLLSGHWVCGSAFASRCGRTPWLSPRGLSLRHGIAPALPAPTGYRFASAPVRFNCVIFCRVARSGPLIAGVSFSQCLGATSNSHSHSQPCCSHSWQTGLHSRHCSRYRQQRAHGGRPTLEPQPIKPLFDAANLTIFWQTAAPPAEQTHIFQKFSPASGGIGGLPPTLSRRLGRYLDMSKFQCSLSRAPRLSGSRALLSFHSGFRSGRSRFALRAALVLSDFRVVHENAEGRRANRIRRRSRVVRNRGKRARIRAKVRATASSAHTEADRVCRVAV